MKKISRNTIWTIVRFLITALIFFLIFKFIKIPLLAKNLHSINWEYIVLVVILVIPSIFTRILRWYLILNKDAKQMTLAGTTNITLIGLALNIFLPMGGGDVAKSYFGWRKYRLKEEMLSSVIIDKIIAVFAVFFLGVFSSITAYRMNLIPSRFAIPFGVISITITILLTLPIFFPKVIPWQILNWLTQKIFKKSFDYSKLLLASTLSNKLKFYTIFISMIGWLITYLQFYFVCLAYNVHASYIYILSIAPMIILGQLFPLTLNGMGSQEAVIMYLFSKIKVASATSALLISLTATIINAFLPALIGAGLIIFQGTEKEKAPISQTSK